MVNGVSDSQQTGKSAASVSMLAGRCGLPSVLVDVRHEATHNHLPSLQLLRHSAQLALEWLTESYWCVCMGGGGGGGPTGAITRCTTRASGAAHCCSVWVGGAAYPGVWGGGHIPVPRGGGGRGWGEGGPHCCLSTCLALGVGGARCFLPHLRPHPACPPRSAQELHLHSAEQQVLLALEQILAACTGGAHRGTPTQPTEGTRSDGTAVAATNKDRDAGAEALSSLRGLVPAAWSHHLVAPLLDDAGLAGSVQDKLGRWGNTRAIAWL